MTGQRLCFIMLENPSVCFQIHLTKGKVVLIQFNKYLLTISDVPVFKTYVTQAQCQIHRWKHNPCPHMPKIIVYRNSGPVTQGLCKTVYN